MSQVLKTAWLVILMATVPVRPHERPMIQAPTPTPPPVIEPGPDAALLKISIHDKSEDCPASATVSVNNGDYEPDFDPYKKFSLRQSANRHKGPIRFRPLNYYFFSNGLSTVRVNPGPVVIEVMKGYEYKPEHVHLNAAPKETLSVTIELEKIVDMEKAGWYSGDTHIHMDRTGSNDDTLITITSAKNIRYAHLLSMNTTGYDRGKKYESWLQKKGLGDGSVYQKGPYFLVSGQEYRTRRLGHVTIILPDDYVPGIGETGDVEKGPSLAVIADQAHEAHGYIGLAHGGYVHQEADGLLLADKMDFLELLQFGGYRSLGLDGWYDFLNIGYRLPIVGACDFPYTRELGSEITYVRSESRPTPRTFARMVAEGKSFATSGPLLFLTVNGKMPGDIVNLPADTDKKVQVNIKVVSPIYPVRYVELIVNGRVVNREMFQELQPTATLTQTLRIDKSCWIAARTYAEAGTDAHTNPVYFYVADKPPFNRDSGRHILARLDGSIESITNRDVIERLVKLKKELENKMEGRDSGLPLPRMGN